MGIKEVEIYTDGSCSGNTGPGGWGVILKYGDNIRELSGGSLNTTNNQMELTAVIQGLAALKTPCKVMLYTDSKYIVDAINKGWLATWSRAGWCKSDKKPVANIELWKVLIALIGRHDVWFNWVKGHADNEYNNRCDKLATMETNRLKS